MTPAVLVVEPDNSFRGCIAWCLLARGYRVLAAETLLEATHSLLAGGVDLMILDIDLSPAGARALLRYMSEDAELAETRVVVVGRAPQPDLNAPFLQRPFCDEDLVDSVYRMLGPPRRQSQSAELPRLRQTFGV